MSNPEIKVGDVLVSYDVGSSCQRGVVTKVGANSGSPMITYEVTESNRSDVPVGSTQRSQQSIIHRFYTIAPAPIAQEATMFTTTLTRTVTTTETLDICEGDVFVYNEDKTSAWKVLGLSANGRKLRAYSTWLGSTQEYPFTDFKDTSTRYHFGGAPLERPTTVDEPFEVTHKFAVGDVITWGTRAVTYEIAEVVLSKGYPRYRALAVGSGKEQTFDVAYIDGESSVTLEGGPRLQAKLDALTVLREARNLISVPEKWTKGEWQTAAGRMCLTGALNAAVTGAGKKEPNRGTAEHDAWFEAVQVVEKTIPTGSIIGFNDANSTTHDKVLAVLDKAIADVQFNQLVVS